MSIYHPGLTVEQAKLLDQRNRKLYLAFRDRDKLLPQKQMKLELAKKYNMSRSQVCRLFTLFKRGEWEAYAPMDREYLAPITKWVPSGFIREPTKYHKMTGRFIRSSLPNTMHWRGQIISLEG